MEKLFYRYFRKCSAILTVFVLPMMTFLGMSCSDDDGHEAVVHAPHLNVSDSLVMVQIHKEINSNNTFWDDTDTNTWKGHVAFILDKAKNEYRVAAIGYEGDASGYFPQEITKLDKLKLIYFSGSYLTGKIPEDIGKLKDLESIVISENHISGTLPESLGELSKLARLYISNTDIGGKLPSSWQKLERLETLVLSNNKLEGSIPSELKELKHVTTVILSNNHLSGSVPIEILKETSPFVLENNDITELPFDIWKDDNPANPPQIKGNRLSGIIPAWVKETTKWKKLKGMVSEQQPGYGYSNY